MLTLFRHCSSNLDHRHYNYTPRTWAGKHLAVFLFDARA